MHFVSCTINSCDFIVHAKKKKEREMTLRRKMTKMALRRRILTQMMIDLPIFMFSSLVKDIIAFI